MVVFETVRSFSNWFHVKIWLWEKFINFHCAFCAFLARGITNKTFWCKSKSWPMTSKGKTLLNLEDKGEKSFLVKKCGNYLEFHSVEIWGFVCHSDFTWNWFWPIGSCKYCHFANKCEDLRISILRLLIVICVTCEKLAKLSEDWIVLSVSCLKYLTALRKLQKLHY